MRLPDVHIIGAGKSGSSSLFAYLAQHPEIYTPGPPEGRWKEPRTLLYLDGIPRNPPSDLNVIDFNEYLEMWRPAGNRKALEGSIIYMLYHDIVIPNLRKVYDRPEDVYYIAILRDPVDRALSHYNANIMAERETLSFAEATNPSTIRRRLENGGPSDYDYLSQGMYYEQVKAYIEAFPSVKVCLFEDLKADPSGLIKDIFEFIGVERREVKRRKESGEEIGEERRMGERRNDSFTKTKHNPSIIVRFGFLNRLLKKPDLISSVFPPIRLISLEKRISMTRKLQRLNTRKETKGMGEETKERLKEFYREDILKLQDLIGRDLSHWL